jgi:site-specific recombinase
VHAVVRAVVVVVVVAVLCFTTWAYCQIFRKPIILEKKIIIYRNYDLSIFELRMSVLVCSVDSFHVSCL